MNNEQLYEDLRSNGYPVATNYRQRARNILEQLLWGMEAIVGPRRRKKVTPAMIEAFIDELPGILNLYLEDKDKRYSNLPLTEEQMTAIEQNMACQKSTIINTDDFIYVTVEPAEKSLNKEGK